MEEKKQNSIREHAYTAMFILCYWSTLHRKSVPSHVQVNIEFYVRLCLFCQAQYAGTASQVVLSFHSIPQINGVKFKTVNAMHVCLLHNKDKNKKNSHSKLNKQNPPKDKLIFLNPDQKCWAVKDSRSVVRFLHMNPLKNGATSQ